MGIKKIKKPLAVLLLFVMLPVLVGGCKSKVPAKMDNNVETGASDNNDAGQATQRGEGIAMGRYLEEVTDLSDSIMGYSNGIYRLADKTLVITDECKDFLVSKDNGFTWEKDRRDWYTKMQRDSVYIMDLAVGADGTVGVVYDDGEDEAEDQEAGDVYESKLNPKLKLIEPDGTELSLEVTITENDKYINKVWITDSGRVFVSTLGFNIYEILKDGQSEKFLTLDARPELVQFIGNLVIMDGYDYGSLIIYDMEKKEYVEDKVLDNFINENYKNRSFNGSSWYDLYFFGGEAGVLYLAGKKGLHRHVIGGSAIEQIIDGKLSTFNNPAYGLLGMTMLENNEFIALFNGARLVRFTYNADVPTVPNEKVKAYSLKENDTMRQAIALYQAANPEIYVEYEVGMGENDSVTREDALKKLNTEIMAGNGPDLLILDDLPIDSYIEKGLLLDLSPFLKDFNGDSPLFSNIVDAFRENDKIFTIPCEIHLPVIEGKEKYVSQMTDMEGIAGAIEELRKDNPNEDLLGICSEKGVMKLFAMVCAPSWKTQSGEIDKEAISDFLAYSKRIYDAQMSGLSEKYIERYNEINEWYMQDYGMTREDSDNFAKGVDEMSYIAGDIKLVLGTVSYAYAYAELISVQRAAGFADSEITPLNGQSSQVFCAETLAGINAASDNIGLAEELLRVLLGKESVASYGFPINRTAFEESLLSNDEFYVSDDVPYSGLAMTDAEGRYFSLSVYWINKEQTDVLRDWAASVDTPYVEDTYLEDLVYEAGIAYMQGDKNLEEAVDSIEKQTALYMAE